MWRAAEQVEVTRDVRCRKDPFAESMVDVEARREHVHVHVAPTRLPVEGLQHQFVVDVLAELTWGRPAEQARRVAVSRHVCVRWWKAS